MGRFLEHLLRLPLGFFLQRDTGELVARAQSNTDLQNLFSTQMVTALLDGFLLLGFLGLMTLYEPQLAGLVAALGAVEAGLLWRIWDRHRQLSASGLAAAGREGAALVEALSGLEATKASGAEDRMLQRWTDRMVERVEHDRRRQGLALASATGLVLFRGLSTLAVFAVGGHLVLAHRMTLGTFVGFLTLQGLFSAPLGSLMDALLQVQFLGTHLRRLDDVLATAPEPAGSRDPGRLDGAVELQEVAYRHSPGAPLILESVSLKVVPGAKVALVGSTGSGKSTLARLLLGLHLPESGRVLLDGHDLRDLDLLRIRRQVGVVLQETFLFDDTVRANLALHQDHLPLARLQWAARLACVDDVIGQLPQGYDSRIGESGCRLSGGQRQRLALARALARDPAILLLDEATSSLDPATEARVHANLAGLGCTRILIAHRLATVRDADRILVLQDRRIVQQGTFLELQERSGPFRDLLLAAGGDHG
jgi:ABC-type bacteriocin/lantibiotic exporter with double-glycine peptidase domain